MKGFQRENQWLSLCGLNCGLCPMRLENHCGGCGNGNQSCRIARCSLEHGGVAYCDACPHYPCENYQHIDEFDSFITHRRQKADLEKAQRIGIEAYNLEQQEKAQILLRLLTDFNDGRRKNFFCVAVNLLELSEIKEVLHQLETDGRLSSLPIKARCAHAVEALQEIANGKGIQLKLTRKK